MRPLLVLALFALLAAPAAAQTQPVDTTPTIAADGLGTATLTPDVADVSAGVDRAAPTSRGARNAANRRLAAVRKAIKAAGVADADVRTVGLTIQRERVKKNRVRYRASQQIVVHVRAVAGLAALIDAMASAGADQIGDPEFGFADPSAGRTLATRAALADARRRADDAAAVAGLRITGVRTVDLDPNSDSCCDEPASSGSGGSAKSPGDSPTKVSPGTQDFNERVRVVYTAAPAV